MKQSPNRINHHIRITMTKAEIQEIYISEPKGKHWILITRYKDQWQYDNRNNGGVPTRRVCCDADPDFERGIMHYVPITLEPGIGELNCPFEWITKIEFSESTRR